MSNEFLISPTWCANPNVFTEAVVGDCNNLISHMPDNYLNPFFYNPQLVAHFANSHCNTGQSDKNLIEGLQVRSFVKLEVCQILRNLVQISPKVLFSFNNLNEVLNYMSKEYPSRVVDKTNKTVTHFIDLLIQLGPSTNIGDKNIGDVLHSLKTNKNHPQQDNFVSAYVQSSSFFNLCPDYCEDKQTNSESNCSVENELCDESWDHFNNSLKGYNQTSFYEMLKNLDRYELSNKLPDQKDSQNNLQQFRKNVASSPNGFCEA